MSDPFRHIARRRLTSQERAMVFAEHDGRCASCRRKLGPADKWDADHAIALELGGTNDISNFHPLCEWCHKPKTAEDHAKAGHSRRVYAKHYVPSEFRRSNAWGRR